PGSGGGAARVTRAEGRRRRVDAEAHDAVALAGQVEASIRVRDGTEGRVAVDAEAHVRARVGRGRWKELAIRAAEVGGVQQESLAVLARGEHQARADEDGADRTEVDVGLALVARPVQRLEEGLRY